MQLYGWDTVYASSIANANAALAASREAIAMPFEHRDGDIVVRGKADSWSIVPGGSGQLVHLEVKIGEGVYAHGDVETDISGIGVILEVSLKLAPPANNGALMSAGQPEKLLLQFDFRTPNKLMASAASGWSAPRGAGAITPVRIDDPEGKLSALDKMVVSDAIALFLVDRSQHISTVLAEIDLVDHGSDGWLSPKKSAYAYVERQDGFGALVVFGVTEDRSIDNIERAIDPALITADAQGYFALSPQMFVRHVILPMMPKAFGNGAKPASFKYDAKSNLIKNAKALKADKVKGYQPMINALSIGVDKGSLAMSASGICDMNFMGVEMSFSVTAKSPLTYDPKTQNIGFKEDPDPKATHTYKIPPWTRVLWYALGVLPGVVMEIVVPLIASSIAKGLTAQAGNLMLAKNPPRTVHWAGTRSMTVKQAGLSSAFFMRGDFN